MYKYIQTEEISFEEYCKASGLHLDPQNTWIALSRKIDWEAVESAYAAQFFGTTGHPAKPGRMAVGALIIQSITGFSDRKLCMEITADPYLQFFLGAQAFQPIPHFTPPALVSFRKRLSTAVLGILKSEIPELCFDPLNDLPSIHKGPKYSFSRLGDPGYDPNDPASLNRARRVLERIIDHLHKASGSKKKPRTYKKVARQEYDRYSRRKNQDTQAFIKHHRAYVRRDIRIIQGYLTCGYSVPETFCNEYQVIENVFNEI